MAHSKIEICNTALAMLGEDAIRSFSESNKRSRMCDVFFEITKNYLLKFDWPFARKYVQLQEVDSSTMTIPDGTYVYRLPSDCKQPRDIAPRGTNDSWEVMGRDLYCQIGSDVYLYYTAKADDASRFSDSFASLLALGLAVKLCMPITQDKALAKELRDLYREEQQNAWESEANVGNTYREPDEDPNNDSFVNPDGSVLAPYRLNEDDS